MTVQATIMAQARVDVRLREQMLRLHRRYFCHVLRRNFMADLAEKDWVIILRVGGGLVGFSTLQLIRIKIQKCMHVFIFSGDTIVDQAHWNSPALAGSFVHFMLRTLAERRGATIHWFLITKGYRTYRFLPVFFNNFYPSCLRPTPATSRRLLDVVAHHKFGDAYDSATGLVRMAGKKDRLRHTFSTVPSSRQQDPHVAFFLRRNPNHALGDELACLTPVTRANLNRLAWRVCNSTAVTWIE